MADNGEKRECVREQRRGQSTVDLNGGSGGGYPTSGPELNFNGSGAS